MISKDKTIIFLGSSVTEGGAAGGWSMCEYVQETMEYNVIKWAVSGTTLADINENSYVSRLKKAMSNQEKCDCFICQLSTNDASNNILLGEISSFTDRGKFDVRTTIGAMEYIVSCVKEKWECPILFYTGTYFENEKYQRMVEMLLELSKKWGFGVINLWDDPHMRAVSTQDYDKYMHDPVHPTKCGYQVWWGPKFADRLKQIFLYQKAIEVLKSMSLREKIGQLNQEPLKLENLEEIKTQIRNGELGSLILATSATAGNDEQQKLQLELLNELERIAVEESPSGIPLIFGRDVIHGHQTVLPIPLALSATFHPELVKDSYRCVAKEASNEGVQWTFSPMIDISRDPRWGRCIEGIGEDPYLGSLMASAVVQGFQGEDYSKQDSLAACAKHYIGYGAVEGGRDYGKAEISDYTLRNYYLKPFKAAVEAGVATVMSSFNEVSGVPLSASRYLLYDLLKEELGFEGYIVSDWGSVWELMVHGVAEDRSEAARIAMNAGLDMEMVSRCFIDHLEKLVKDGKVKEETIDEAVLRIIYIKLLFGIFDHPYTVPEIIDYEKHRKLAKACSDEAMVLLKNKNHILPLSKETKVFAVGPMLHEKKAHFGSWTLDGDVSKVISIKEAFMKQSANVILADSDHLWDESLKSVRKCDAVVVLLGESPKLTGEANSLARIELPGEQLEFVKRLHALGKPIIGVMAFGRPIALEEAESYFDAILYAWHCGTCASDSIVSILYGEVNPSGSLPMSFPRCTGQIPVYYNYPNTMAYGRYYYSEDVYAYNDCVAMPLYPFGYGLSYTEFEYSEVSCPERNISYKKIMAGHKFKFYLTVKNAGTYDGYATTQCYIRDKVASMTRPLRELKGISKEFLKAGEEKEICFALGFDELAFYNAEAKFEPEAGEFEIYIGRDCYAPLCCTIRIDGY